MYHAHFNTIHSTQLYLKDNLQELLLKSENILISTSLQTLGVGRLGSRWDHYPNSLAMSFTIAPHPIPTLTPIEIGILVIQFLKNRFSTNIKLKWPNDLMTLEQKKCGGILAQYLDAKVVICGLGINLGNETPEAEVPSHYKHGKGEVMNYSLSDDETKSLCHEFYQFLLTNRMNTAEEVVKEFNNNCLHINRLIEISDDDKIIQGIFLGIGKNGEAQVSVDNTTHSYLSSSLKILN